MAIELSAPAKIHDRDSLYSLLFAYYSGILPQLAAVGGPAYAPDAMLSGLWDDIDAYLPPNGAVILAHDDGDLVGCGFLKRIRPDAGELKRLYVHPKLRGTGLGRALLNARIDAARKLGLRDLYADTVTGNTAMLDLYDANGFRHIDRYPENANSAELDPWLVYLHRRL